MTTKTITKGSKFITPSNGTEWIVTRVKDGMIEARGFSVNGRCVGVRVFFDACLEYVIPA